MTVYIIAISSGIVVAVVAAVVVVIISVLAGCLLSSFVSSITCTVLCCEVAPSWRPPSSHSDLFKGGFLTYRSGAVVRQRHRSHTCLEEGQSIVWVV